MHVLNFQLQKYNSKLRLVVVAFQKHQISIFAFPVSNIKRISLKNDSGFILISLYLRQTMVMDSRSSKLFANSSQTTRIKISSIHTLAARIRVLLITVYTAQYEHFCNMYCIIFRYYIFYHLTTQSNILFCNPLTQDCRCFRSLDAIGQDRITIHMPLDQHVNTTYQKSQQVTLFDAHCVSSNIHTCPTFCSQLYPAFKSISNYTFHQRSLA